MNILNFLFYFFFYYNSVLKIYNAVVWCSRMHSQIAEFQPYMCFFTDYVRRYYSADPKIHENIKLKEDHSLRVVENTEIIIRHLNLTRNELLLALIIALFHDIGRFEQFSKYQTFSDSISCNHAEKSVEVLKKEKVLDNLDKQSQDLIFTAILNHNKKVLPKTTNEKQDLLNKLIRDADKLDIWRVVLSDLENGNKNSSITLGFSNKAKYNPVIIEKILRKEMVDYADIQSVTDFLLTSLSWIYDINFVYSLKIISERSYIERIFKLLPVNDLFSNIKEKISTYIEERLS